MPVAYTCPNPACQATLKSPNPIAPGKRIKCPKCEKVFVPVPAEAPAVPAAPADGGGTLKFADDPPKKPATPKAAPSPPPPPPPAPARNVDDDDEDAESVRRGYGIVQETEEEIKKAEENKPVFGAVQDKYKRSARGPAIGMLVGPANLLIAEGILTTVGGIAMFVIGFWPLVFADAPPGEEEIEDAVVTMLLAVMVTGWGAFICFGTSQMQELKSYTWALAGAVMGILPLLVGIYAVIMLQKPEVKAGFQETDGAVDEDEDEKKEKDEDEEDDEDDEDED